jgi:multicomponent Na+:H+ antiporter subunit D
MLVYPILIPFASAALSMVSWRRWVGQQAVNLAGASLHLAACLWVLTTVHRSGIASAQMGNWPAPFGITLVADHLSALMLVVTGLLNVAVVCYARADLPSPWTTQGFYPLFHILIGGVSGAFLTGDLFNLYVWFEVLLMSSFGLLVWGQTPHQFEAAVKYVVMNLLATLLFIIALALLYGLTGTLNMAHLHQQVTASEAKGLLTVVALLFTAAFGIKSALFPLFFWLPASYHTPSVSVSALFSGLLTKVGVYALIRVFTLIFTHDAGLTHGLLLAMAVLSMVTGVLGAVAHNDFRRILSFHIISQVGYMVLGLALLTPLALAGTVFYLVHHMIVKANLFLVSGLSLKAAGSFDLGRLGGLYRNRPMVAVLFFIPAFSLAGFPPLSGFWAKLLLIRATLEVDQFLVAAVAVGVALMTIYSMTKIWMEVFWKPLPREAGREPSQALSAWMVAPVLGLASVTVGIGLAAEPVYRLAAAAAHEMMNPDLYVRAVLGGLGL